MASKDLSCLLKGTRELGGDRIHNHLLLAPTHIAMGEEGDQLEDAGDLPLVAQRLLFEFKIGKLKY